MKKTYRGSCHCGAVRFEADIDLAAGTVKCNCSICAKGRNWLAAVGGDSFRLISGESDLSDYRFGSKTIGHRFCKHCGMHPYSGNDKFYAVSIACLDDADPAEIIASPVTWVDGLHDNFKSPPAETRHL